MKSIIFASFLLCLAGTTQAQQQTQQADSTPPALGWMQLTTRTTAGFDYISLVGKDTVYVSGENPIRSTDGGMTWDSLTNVPSYQGVRMRAAKVQFVDNTTGFLCGSNDTVYKTTDGGQDWFTNTATGLPGGLIPYAMVFKNRNFGCILGGDNSRTTDGGTTWLVSGAFGEFNCMAFADTANGYEMGPATVWLPDVRKPAAAAFERTTDGGATWNLSYAGPSADGKHSGITSGIEGIAAITSDTIIAVGLQIARSFDAGVDWDTIAFPGADGFNSFFAVSFPDRLHGTAVGSSDWIVYTSDGGNTWQRQTSPFLGNLGAVAFADSLLGYACGSGGGVIKTTNAGLSWVQLTPGEVSLQGSVYPNPANDQTTISYGLPEAQHVTLTIQNVTGVTDLHILNGSLRSMGPHSVPIDIRSLSCGTYFVHIQTEKYFDVIKFQVICN